jgi:hypothetical protein
MSIDMPLVTLNELRRNIPLFGPRQTGVILSEPGVGKSSLLYMLAEDLGDKFSPPIYFDAPSMDYGDVGQRIPNRDTKKLEFMVAEEIDFDDPRPKLIMIDEFLKCGKMMRIIFTRLILDRVVGNRKLPEGSIVIATSNNATDGVGDFAQAHEGNRVTFFQLAKPTAQEWVAWAMLNGVSDVTCSFAMMNESVFDSYLDEKARSNPFIFNPKTNNRSFVSPRSLFKADAAYIQNRDKMSPDFIRAALIGTLGKSGGDLLASYLAMEKEVVSPKTVFEDPDNTPIPSKLAVLYMLMFNAVRSISVQDELSAFLKFLDRTKSNELTQGVFFTMLANDKSKSKLAYQNARIQKWMQANPHLVFG